MGFLFGKKKEKNKDDEDRKPQKAYHNIQRITIDTDETRLERARVNH